MLLPFRMIAVALAGVVATGLVLRADTPPASDPAWNAAVAARYLDARMDVWWAKAKTLKTGDGEAKCLSCHTAVPYALARPALRRATGVSMPTAHETKVLDTLRLRVTRVADEAPFYDHTEAKKVESRGVEAVLNAFLLTQSEVARGAADGPALTRAALARLWDVQRSDGAWDWLDFGLEPYETTDAAFHGATLAAMAAGSPAGRAASDEASKAGVTRLQGYVRANLASQRLFNQTWALLAAARMSDLLVTADRDAILTRLDARQRADGGWALADLGPWRWSKTTGDSAAPGKTDQALLDASDAYATGLVVYAMKASGRRASQAAVARGVAWLLAHQQPERTDDAAWAPWRAYSLNFDREHGGDKGEPWRRMFMSDMATAFAVLALQ